MARKFEPVNAHDTAPTEFVEADGIRFAYRRFGNPAGIPVVFVQHFRGNLDNHDSAITSRLADTREVVLFDNAEVGQTSGPAKDTIEDMARDASGFIDALGLGTVDIVGHSMGGHVTQRCIGWRLTACCPASGLLLAVDAVASTESPGVARRSLVSAASGGGCSQPRSRRCWHELCGFA
jgi:pimeloyl-ACP methyl ester carboxylesterase